MLTLTITMKGTRHRIVLGFDTLQSSAAQMEKFKGQKLRESVMLTDDYGQVATIFPASIIWMNLVDQESYMQMRFDLDNIRLKTKNAHEIARSQSPDLKFHVGKHNPRFDRK